MAEYVRGNVQILVRRLVAEAIRAEDAARADAALVDQAPQGGEQP